MVQKKKIFFFTDYNLSLSVVPDDGNMIKHLLTRLTNHSTFPNILFRGQSIGGSDNLNKLHTDKTLAELIEKAGATPRSDGSTLN